MKQVKISPLCCELTEKFSLDLKIQDEEEDESCRLSLFRGDANINLTAHDSICIMRWRPGTQWRCRCETGTVRRLIKERICQNVSANLELRVRLETENDRL